MEDEAAAERQLLSYAAATPLSPAQRTQVLGLTSTQERLNLCLAALREQQRRLAAMSALSSLGGSPGSSL